VLRRTIAPARPASERNYRRAITETPKRDAEVIVGPAAPTTPVPVTAVEGAADGAAQEPAAAPQPNVASSPEGDLAAADVGAAAA
jgi:hypothetical protein